MEFLKKINGVEDLIVFENDDHIEIHFGDIDNELVPFIHKEIERSLIQFCPAGDCSIITTQGEKQSLISVLFYPDKDNEIYFLNIEHI
jgi:hypothetical protein